MPSSGLEGTSFYLVKGCKYKQETSLVGFANASEALT